ncbi:MAG: hypothetical protein WC378_21070, partial [Opitutaceae bacterium]
MKTNSLTQRMCAPPGAWTALAALASLVVLPSLAYSESAPAPSEAKEYALFIGGNLEVPQDKVFYPVKRVFKNDLEIEVNKALKRLSIDDVQEYRIVREPKLASTSANITIKRSEKTQAGANRAKLNALSESLAV